MDGSERTLQLLLVEDHQVVAEGLRALLEDYPDLHVVGWAATVREAAAEAARQPVDVALVDYRLPDGSGAEAVAAIREHRPRAAAVMLSVERSDEAMMAAVASGASGYLLKSAPSEEVVSALRRAADGDVLIPVDQMAALVGRRSASLREEARRQEVRASLTSREREILALLAEGLDNRAIAARLCIEYTTVRSHSHRLLGKLGARSQLEAVAKAADLGLLP